MSARGLRGLAGGLIAGAWSALGYGLYFSPSDQTAWGDLDAGGRFGANFAVYWPFLALTVPLVAVVLLGFLRTPIVLIPLGSAAVVVATFAAWVSTQGYLFDAQPWLQASIAVCLIVNVTGGVTLAIAWALGRHGLVHSG